MKERLFLNVFISDCEIFCVYVYILCGMAQMYSSKIQIFSLAVMFSGRRDDGAETVDSALCLHADHL